MVAKVNGICTLLKEVELNHVGDKKIAVCKPFVVFDRKFKKNGSEEWQEERCAIALELWGKNAEMFADSVSVGDQVVVDGYLLQNSWTDGDGNQRTTYLVRVDMFRKLVSMKTDNNRQTANGRQNNSSGGNRGGRQTQAPKNNRQTNTSTRRTPQPQQSEANYDVYSGGFDGGDDQVPF